VILVDWLLLSASVTLGVVQAGWVSYRRRRLSGLLWLLGYGLVGMAVAARLSEPLFSIALGLGVLALMAASLEGLVEQPQRRRKHER